MVCYVSANRAVLGSPESIIDYDVRQIDAQGIESYSESLIRGELSDAFWNAGLPQSMDTSASSSPYFRVFQAASDRTERQGLSLA